MAACKNVLYSYHERCETWAKSGPQFDSFLTACRQVYHEYYVLSLSQKYTSKWTIIFGIRHAVHTRRPSPHAGMMPVTTFLFVTWNVYLLVNSITCTRDSYLLSTLGDNKCT